LAAVLMIIPEVLSGLAGGVVLAGCLLLNLQTVRRLQKQPTQFQRRTI
jgi:hypothetical protein